MLSPEKNMTIPVDSAKIVNGSIVTADLADNSITSAKIVNGTIATADIADDAITNAKIAIIISAVSVYPVIIIGLSLSKKLRRV